MQTSTFSPELQAGKAHYERDGYAIFPHVLDAELMGEAGRHLDWLIAKHPDRRPEDLQNIVLGTDPFWLRLVSDSRLLDIAQMFIGPDIALFGAHYFCKPAQDGKAVLWHQDGAYWPLEPMEVVTLWLAVGDVTPENGCLQIIPGSQALNLQEMQTSHNAGDVLGSQIAPALVDETRAVSCAMKAGGVEVHHPNIIHGSQPNTSPHRRDAMAIRYIPTSTRITQTPWETFLLRGQAVAGVNVYAAAPAFDADRHFEFSGRKDWN